MKKSFSSGGAISSPGKTESKDHDSSKKKSSSTPSKNQKDKENKESKDKDKLMYGHTFFPSPSFLLPFIPYPFSFSPFLSSSLSQVLSQESGDKALRKSASKKKQGIRKSTELKVRYFSSLPLSFLPFSPFPPSSLFPL